MFLSIFFDVSINNSLYLPSTARENYEKENYNCLTNNYKMKKLMFLLVFCALGISAVWAQKTFSGKVLGPDGLGLPGVSVVEKANSTNGVATDLDGNWTLTVPSGKSVLQFSTIGMKTVELAANNATSITMKEDSQMLDEVMIISYGTAKKSSFTGSAATVKSDELVKKPVISVGQALDGLASGVQVSSGSGQPGSTPSIRIRGIGSINASNEPLYVIDGVPQFSDDLSVSSSSSLGTLSSLNPNDIANVTVLKDASAAALYGSRAANGVVLITTKRGKAGKTEFSVKGETGFSDFAVDPLPLATPKEAFDYKVLGYKNYLVEYEGMSEAEAQKTALSDIGGYFSQYDPNRPESDYNWDDALFSTGKTNNVEFSARGGNEKTKFFASLGYLDVEGVATGSNFKRISGRLNLDHKANDIIELGATSYISRMKQNVIPTNGYYYANPLYATRGFLNQLTPIRTPDGKYAEVEGGKKPNLVKENGLNFTKNDIWTINQQAFVKLNLMEGLTFKSTNSFDFTISNGSVYWSPISQDGESYNGYSNEQNKRRLKLSTSNILNYTKSINEVHNIDFLVGYEAEKLQDKVLSASGKNFPNDVSTTLDVAAKPLTAYFNHDGDRMQSVLSRLNYNYDNKYYASASFRTDASSRLGANNRWGQFWALSGAWRITSEKFMENVDFVNDLKLRVSYGVNGVLHDDWTGSLGLYSFGKDYNSVPGTLYTQIENKDLSWEKNNTLSLALEGRIFEKLSFELEYFNKKTTDLLLEVPTSRTTGFSSYWANVGEMTNTGFEVTLKSLNIDTDDFKWNTSLSLSHYKNTVDKLVGGDNVATFPYILREGESFCSMYMRDWAGVNPENGHGQWYVLEDEKRVDKDGDGKFDVTEDTRKARKKIVGDGVPDLTGSLNNMFSYKGFDFSFLLTFKLGGDAYIDPYWSLFDDGAGINKAILKAQVDDYWTTPGQATELPKPVYSNPQHTNYNSSRRIKDGTFMRLKSVNLGYKLPSKWVEKAGLTSVRFYGSATNLLTFSELDDYGLDPETTSRGTVLDSFDFPPMKTITFGVQVNF